jgi:hypothetical protein
MVLNHELFKNIPLHIQGLICEKKVFKMEDHFGEEALNLNLAPKFGLVERITFASFLNHLLERV